MLPYMQIATSPIHIEKSSGIIVTERQTDTKGTMDINNHYAYGSQMGSTIRVGSTKMEKGKKMNLNRKGEKRKTTNGSFERAIINSGKKHFPCASPL